LLLTLARERIAFGLAALGAVLASSSAAGAALTERAVLATRANELEPSATLGYFAWVSAPRRHPRHFGVFARPTGGQKFKVNANATLAFLHNNAIEGVRLV
jgi:hypothetical protein